MDEKIFVDGMIVKRRDTAPNYVLCNLSIKVDEFIEFAKDNERNGWLNIDCMLSQGGNTYAQLDTWEPNKDREPRRNREPQRERGSQRGTSRKPQREAPRRQPPRQEEPKDDDFFDYDF